MAGRGAGPDFVEALARGLDVLACFDADHRTMSLSEVATAAGLGATLAQPSRAGLPPSIGRSAEQLREELTEVRARGWALADEELAPGVRSVAVPVRDGTGAVRAAMNVTVHAAETSRERLLEHHLPLLLRTAGEVSAEWALWQSRPHVEVPRRS